MPGSARDLRRVLGALQATLARDAVLPSHASVVSVAAVGATASLAALLPAAVAPVTEMLLDLTRRDALAPRVHIAATAACLRLAAARGDCDAIAGQTVAAAACAGAGSAASVLASATTAVQTAAHTAASRARKRRRGGGAKAADVPRASLDAIAAVHVLVGRHANPAVRHEAFRFVRAAAGGAPSLVNETIATEELEAEVDARHMRTHHVNPVLSYTADHTLRRFAVACFHQALLLPREGSDARRHAKARAHVCACSRSVSRRRALGSDGAHRSARARGSAPHQAAHCRRRRE